MRRILFIVLVSLVILNISAQRNMENLGRGLVAVRTDENKVFLSWRMLGSDPSDIDFNLYRDGILISSTSATNYIDTTNDNSLYFVRPVINGLEQNKSSTVGVQTKAYLGIPLQQIGDY